MKSKATGTRSQLSVPKTFRAVCPGCQTHRQVRRDGLVRRHTSPWTDRSCLGAGATPIPIPVPKPDFSAAGLLDGKTLDRWDFLSLPLVTLLHITRAEVREVAVPGFVGSVRPMVPGSPWRWIVWMPVGGEVLDHDLKVRGLLAAVHGVDTASWPLQMAVRPEPQA